ncbi:sigma-70 family RNA polymerase sigma factor [Streptomyces massasporeus]|uniref:sigma-70 family RNA polymerase sigma factor n=1 Tax=Streptomyces massasporeus TaxID=67324 RepID=UPI0016741A36|nr:sigma-70 family RNA polymerase sigma factor [Streptomyces massasporeus]GGV90033.1 RNA polymerase sigma factor [Streptomyces massasporeus]
MGSPTSPAPRPSDGEPASGIENIAQCVTRAQAGDSVAFAQLYDAYSDTVYRYLYYRTGGRTTAEDLCSEAFTRAFQHLDTFTWKGRDFGAWLVTIARNLAADHFASARFRLEVTTGELLDANGVERSPEEVVVEAFRHRRLLDALSRLPPRMRQVTWLWAIGTPPPQIARQLGISASTVRVHLYQARQRLAADPLLASHAGEAAC